MRNIRNSFKVFLGALLGMFVSVSSAFAEGAAGVTLPATVDLSSVLTYGGVIVAALAGMIVLRKAIKLTNRS